MYCNKCGKECSNNDLFCRFCGAELLLTDVTSNNGEDSNEPNMISKVDGNNSSGDVETETLQKKKSAFPIMFSIVITIMVVVVVFAMIKMGETPDGSFDKRFAIASIDASLEAQDKDHIMVPMFYDYGIKASAYEENGGFGGIQSEDDYLNGVSSVVQIICHKDNTFEMNVYDYDVYGDYHYDKESSTITFYVDGNEYWGQYDGREELLMWSDDGSRFVFKNV